MADTESRAAQVGVEEETPSPLCNHLLEQSRLRFEGELSEEDFKDAVQSALQSLDQAREQTLGNLEADEASDEVIDAFERSFEEMQLALEEMEDFSENTTEDGYEAVRTSLIRAARATVFAMTALQQSEFQDGPTDMPLFNALFKMKQNYLAGAVEADALKDALAGIVDMTKKAIEELLAAEGEQPPQRDGLVRAYKEQIESLELLEETVDAGKNDQLDSVFDQLLKTSNQVKDAMSSLNLALMSEGPCRLTRTNVLLSAAEAFRRGGIGPDAFAESVEAFETQLREERDSVSEMTAGQIDSEALKAELEGVAEAYDMHEDALALFSEILEGEVDPTEFDNAKKLLIEASERLSDHKDALIEISENEGKISCVRCGVKNEPGSRVCNSCGAQLPQQAALNSPTLSLQEDDGAAVFGGDLEITTNLEKLFVAINNISEEKISDEEFNEVLVWMDGLLTNARSTMPDVPDLTAPPQFGEEIAKSFELVAEDLHEQRGQMLRGMEEFQAALGTLQSYFETREKEALIRGVQEVRNGALKMQQAEKALNFINASVQEAAKKAVEASEESEAPAE